ncbi:MAG: hypothetical protein LBJ61_05350 [Deltaproteobacteria bacterium]|jgi:hypothetical protein|nr:hypothetical protein [Deltaproteobacteria bacterium]
MATETIKLISITIDVNEEEVTATNSRPIIWNKFATKVEKTAANCPGILSCGSAALVRSVTRDMLAGLFNIAMKNNLKI